MIGPQDLAAYLIDIGLLTADAVTENRVTITEAARRNQNYRVQVEPDASYFVKQGMNDPIDGQTVGTLINESEVLDFLHGLASSSLVPPRKYVYDPRHRLLVLELVESTENLRHYHARTNRFSVRLASAAGRALADLHNSSPVNRLPATLRPHRLPDVFHLTKPPLALFRGASAGIASLLHFIQQFPDLGQAVDDLGHRWRFSHLTHGDPRWDNWVLRSGQRGRPLALVDWEFATVGDPAWDIGCLIGDYLTTWVLSIPEVSGVPIDRAAAFATCPIERIRPPITALWDGYAKQRGFVETEAMEQQTMLQCSAAKLLDAASERMVSSRRLTAQTGALVQLAFNIFADPSATAGQLFEQRPLLERAG